MEPNYWLCILNRKNFEIVKEKNIWGVSKRHKNQIYKTKVGDILVFYVIGEIINNEKVGSEIVGIYKVVSEPYKDTTRIFSSVGTRNFGEIFPYRIKIAPVKIPKKPISFKKLVPELKFITNKKRWSLHLLGGAMRVIPKEDYETILKYLR